MKSILGKVLVCLSLLLIAGAPGWASETTARDAALKARISKAYGKLPLAFEANRGQTDGRVKFLSRGSGHALFLTSTEAVLVLDSARTPDAQPPTVPAEAVGSLSPSGQPATLRMRLLGASARPDIRGQNELPGRVNYLIGSRSSRWLRDIPTYGRVEYNDVYPGVNLAFYGNQGRLEYDFIVAPGSDPRRIRLSLEGTKDVRVDENGDLVLRADGREIRFLKPTVYQEADGSRREVAARYALRTGNEVAFEVGAYDASRPLVIDPVLAFATYLGGGGDDRAFGIAVDSAGNAYVTGSVSSLNFPGTVPSTGTSGYDAFVSKLNPDGTALLYSTLVGGTSYDIAQAIAVDSGGNAYITGSTNSVDFPVASNFRAFAGTFDAFVTKISPNGSSLVYSTFLGGGSSETGYAIAVDSSGSAYVAGNTNSTDFPIVGGFQTALSGSFDGFISKLKPDGSGQVFSTYLGGTQHETINGIALDSSANIYVTGVTFSSDFPTNAPFQSASGGGADAFVVKVKPDGSGTVFSTYLGAKGNDYGRAIDVDSAGSAYIAGYTNSALTALSASTSDFPTASPLQAKNAGGYDAFITKMKSDGSGLVYSTYLGGSGDDFAYGITLDAAGNAFVVGGTQSPDFPRAGAAQQANGGVADAFIAILNAPGSALLFSTYLGGAANDYATAVALDSAGNTFVAGYTQSMNFPTVNPLQSTFGGNTDAFVAKLVQPPVPALNAGGLVNSATYSVKVAPGGIASLFGTGLAVVSTGAKGTPLPTSLAGTSVTVGGTPVPLFFVSPTQINLQLPWELQGQSQVPVNVTTPGGTSNAVMVSPVTFAPGIYTVDASGSGQGIIQIANTVILAAPAGSIPGLQTRPASRGENVVIYATGLGPVTNQPATGQPALPSPLSKTTTDATVTIGGVNAIVSFAGLTPGLAGFYQVNVQVPADAPVGSSVPVALSIGGASSNTVTIAIQ